jgi:hypothetical protein
MSFLLVVKVFSYASLLITHEPGLLRWSYASLRVSPSLCFQALRREA